MKSIRCSIVALLLAVSAHAVAEDDSEPRPLAGEYCIPGEGFVEILSKFASLKASKRDTVGADMSLRLQLDEGEVRPERVELRDGAQTVPVMFDDDNQAVGFTEMMSAASESSTLCFVDPARQGRDFSHKGYALNFGTGVRFRQTPGHHTLEEIRDGLKDGRSHYKKMVGAMGFMVPTFDHIAVAGDDVANPPTIIATAKGQDLGEPAFEIYDNARMIALDTLKDMGADSIRIIGDYRMTPSPDAKTVAKFSGE